LGEGAGVIILEELEHAQKRGAKIYAEMLSFGFSGDANHMTAPCPDGSGAALAMKNALEKAEIKPSDVHLLLPMVLRTPLGDIAETKAVSLSSGSTRQTETQFTKCMTGHTLCAAGGTKLLPSRRD
jgi:3-oxoacyl-[acyl-carrier-protein] synthase II